MKKQNRLTKCIWKVPNKVKKSMFALKRHLKSGSEEALCKGHSFQSLVAVVENVEGK